MELYNQLVENKDVMLMFKSSNRTLNQLIEMCGQTNLSNEQLEAWKFAYENIHNWDVVEKKYAVIKLSSDFTFQSDKVKAPEIIKNVVILIEMLTYEADMEFSKSDWKKIFKKIVTERCSNGMWSDNDDKSIYDVIRPLSETDLFGHWEKDLLFGHLKLMLKTSNGNPFPRYWKLDKKENDELKVEYLKSYAKKSKNESNCEVKIETLDEFLTNFLEKNRKQEFKQHLLKSLRSVYVNSLNDLLTLPANVWQNSLEQPLGTLFGRLKQEIEMHRKQNRHKNIERTKAEIMSDLHKVKRFLYYEANEKFEIEKLGFLDPNALKDGFNEQKNDKKFDGGPVLQLIQHSLEEFCRPPLEYAKLSHGMILWGPPGTGKTKLCEVICKKAGIELVVEPLSSSELNRSKVGETEQLLMSLFARAERMPYLLCCIAIDEIDALTPKRNEKTGEHKVDVLCLLLSLIGGIKDVPNVYVIASTNRLNKMDEAFCRRLQTKFFVGRLPPQKRLEILSRVKEVKVKTSLSERNIDFPNRLHKLAQQITINFSGAAIESFRSRIISYLQNHATGSLTEKILIEISNQVAKDFQILLGSYSIPTLINSSNRTELLLRDFGYTGRVLVDLSDDENCVIQLEHKNGRMKEVHELRVENIKLSHEITPVLLEMAIKKNVDFVQLFDTAMLLNNAAFDDNTIMETILEKKGEWEQYSRAMAIFDVDSLIGVNENVSDSSMGQSLSYSITNTKLWHQVVIQVANSKLENSILGDGHKWVVLITKNNFISSQFKALASFPLSSSELRQKEEDSRDRRCINCENPYKNCKNSLDACNFHDGPLIDIRINHRRNFIPVDRSQLLEILANSKDRQKDIQNYLYLCCFQSQQSSGCKKCYHSDRDNKKDYEKYCT